MLKRRSCRDPARIASFVVFSDTFRSSKAPVCPASSIHALAEGEAGAEYLKPAPNDYLQRWPLSKKVNSSKADADDATLIDRVGLATA